MEVRRRKQNAELIRTEAVKWTKSVVLSIEWKVLRILGENVCLM